MTFRKIKFQSKWMITVLIAVSLIFGLGQAVAATDYPLNEIPLDEATYRMYLKEAPQDRLDAAPASYDARNDGIVTVAKDQGACGSCWAFASVGAMESHIMKQYNCGLYDLSEEQQNRCNTAMGGCGGGNSTAPRYWETTGPITEACYPYTASDGPCSYACTEMDYRVTGFYTTEQTAEAFKTSCYDDGPSYWRYDVYSDFSYNGTGFWYDANPGDVYVNTSGSFRRGGHAVLIIGWDDAKGAFLCKNSWGATGGPQGDGTFWIAYSGHYNNLGFAMSNFNLTGGVPCDCDYCLTDTNGYDWCLEVIGTSSQAYYLKGTVDLGSYTIDAMATYVYNGTVLNMTALGGTSWDDFNYNTRFTTSTHAQGNWVDESGGHGSVGADLVDCGTAAAVEHEQAGPKPGKSR